jgi:hypothetical protein
MRGAILPLHHYVFMAWYLVKHRDNFTFTHSQQIWALIVDTQFFKRGSKAKFVLYNNYSDFYGTFTSELIVITSDTQQKSAELVSFKW